MQVKFAWMDHYGTVFMGVYWGDNRRGLKVLNTQWISDIRWWWKHAS